MQSIFNFCFSDKTFQIVDRTTQGGGGGSIRTLIFSPSALSPGRSASLHALGEFICPCPFPSPPTLHFSGKEEEAGNSYLPRGHFSVHERLHKGSCNNSTKNTLRGELIAKERFHDKKGLSSRSVRRFCLKNGIHLHNRLTNDELEQCTRDVVAVVSKSFLDLSARCSLFSSFFYLHFLVCITVYMSTLQGLKVIFSF